VCGVIDRRRCSLNDRCGCSREYACRGHDGFRREYGCASRDRLCRKVGAGIFRSLSGEISLRQGQVQTKIVRKIADISSVASICNKGGVCLSSVCGLE